jgi:hypothetical protein
MFAKVPAYAVGLQEAADETISVVHDVMLAVCLMSTPSNGTITPKRAQPQQQQYPLRATTIEIKYNDLGKSTTIVGSRSYGKSSLIESIDIVPLGLSAESRDDDDQEEGHNRFRRSKGSRRNDRHNM